jgi:hypothetical protein
MSFKNYFDSIHNYDAGRVLRFAMVVQCIVAAAILFISFGSDVVPDLLREARDQWAQCLDEKSNNSEQCIHLDRSVLVAAYRSVLYFDTMRGALLSLAIFICVNLCIQWWLVASAKKNQ